MQKIAILASHNGSGFDAINNAIKTKELPLEIVLVISNNTNAKVLQKAKTAKIPYFLINAKQYKNPDEKIEELLLSHKVKYIFLSGYMKKIPKNIIQTFTILNSHPSLLPKYGGAGMYGRYVHEAVLHNHEAISGVSIHYVDEVYDSGKIILQKELAITQVETIETLEKRIKVLERSAIVEGLLICLK